MWKRKEERGLARLCGMSTETEQRNARLPSRNPASTHRSTAEAAACCGTGPLPVHLALRGLYSTRHLRLRRVAWVYASRSGICRGQIFSVHDARQAVEQKLAYVAQPACGARAAEC